jgi:SOS-response transcriptional repressor LexA
MAGSATIAAGIDRRRDIVRFVRKFHTSKRMSPSIEEIAEAVGLQSKATVRYHVNILVDEGKLIRDPGRYRSLRPPAKTAKRAATKRTAAKK